MLFASIRDFSLAHSHSTEEFRESYDWKQCRYWNWKKLRFKDFNMISQQTHSNLEQNFFNFQNCSQESNKYCLQKIFNKFFFISEIFFLIDRNNQPKYSWQYIFLFVNPCSLKCCYPCKRWVWKLVRWMDSLKGFGKFPHCTYQSGQPVL